MVDSISIFPIDWLGILKRKEKIIMWAVQKATCLHILNLEENINAFSL
jgi:hypothetical protein